MGYFADSFRALSFTMRSAFRRPSTVHYPVEKRERAERYRNSFALLHDGNGEELCIGCDACAKICPSDVITVVAGPKAVSPATGKKRGTCTDFSLDLNACIYCELCVQVCPTDAIVMCRTPEQPSYYREDLLLTMDRLYHNEEKRPLAWGTGSLLRAMQDPKRGEPKKQPKQVAKKEPGKEPRQA
ncbi:MAG: NADH-quinone oxidoreductase subunit I [Nannocystaceae bacterium]